MKLKEKMINNKAIKNLNNLQNTLSSSVRSSNIFNKNIKKLLLTSAK